MKVNKKLKELIKDKKLIIFGVVGVLILIIFIFLVINNEEGSIEYKVKSSLDRIVEKSDLETVNFTYNVIAKKCKKKEKCDQKSNDIDDFEYVLSCKGAVTAGINFKHVKAMVDNDDKKIVIEMPEALVTEVNVLSLEFLNSDDIPASEFANARKLCMETIEEKSKNDAELLPAAKGQAEVVLQSFYEQWLKSFDEEYKIEVK